MRSRVETLADEVIKDRVLRGIELLNDIYGPDWVDHVDPRRLVMSDESHCVLGQVYGDYSLGLEKLQDQADWVHDGWQFGFDRDPDRVFGDNTETYADLDAAWHTVLA